VIKNDVVDNVNFRNMENFEVREIIRNG